MDKDKRIMCPCCNKYIEPKTKNDKAEEVNEETYNPEKGLYIKCGNCRAVFLPRIKEKAKQILQSINILKRMMI